MSINCWLRLKGKLICISDVELISYGYEDVTDAYRIKLHPILSDSGSRIVEFTAKESMDVTIVAITNQILASGRGVNVIDVTSIDEGACSYWEEGTFLDDGEPISRPEIANVPIF